MRVLSSPRISVVNNQSAILKVVDNLVYFTIKTDTIAATATGSATTSFTATPNVVPVGLVMNVTPQISSDDTILLNLRPAITRILSYVTDPTPGLAVPNRIPQIQTREMESLVKVSSGETAVMGGLITDSAASRYLAPSSPSATSPTQKTNWSYSCAPWSFATPA